MSFSLFLTMWSFTTLAMESQLHLPSNEEVALSLRVVPISRKHPRKRTMTQETTMSSRDMTHHHAETKKDRKEINKAQTITLKQESVLNLINGVEEEVIQRDWPMNEIPKEISIRPTSLLSKWFRIVAPYIPVIDWFIQLIDASYISPLGDSSDSYDKTSR